MKKLPIGLILMVLVVLPVCVHAGVPLETVETQVNRVLDVLRDPALKAESAREAKEKKIEAIAADFFDYNVLSRLTLSRNWKKLNSDQQKEFIELYRQVLQKAYMDKILAYTDEKVVFEKETMLSEKKAEVFTKIVTKSVDIPINYRVFLKDGTWKVYDVIIEGVSLVKNYRTQFQEILTTQTPEDLLKTLREKVGKA